MAELYGVNTDALIGGLAGAGTDAASYLTPMFDFSKVVAPTLDPAAMAGVVAPLAEDGANAATALVPNLTPGLAATTSFGPLAQAAGTPLTNSYFGAGWTPSTPSMFDGIKDTGTDMMKFFNDNSKGLETSGKLIGGLGGLYYQNQMA